MVETKYIKQLNRLFERQKNTTVKLNKINNLIDVVLKKVDIKKVVEKKDHPAITKGKGPYKLCEKMSSGKPMSKEEIAKETRLKVGTVTLYLHQYKCFQLAGRGMGYKYIKPKGKKI